MVGFELGYEIQSVVDIEVFDEYQTKFVELGDDWKASIAESNRLVQYSYQGDVLLFATRILVKKDQQLKYHAKECAIKETSEVILAEPMIVSNNSV